MGVKTHSHIALNGICTSMDLITTLHSNFDSGEFWFFFFYDNDDSDSKEPEYNVLITA